MFSIVFHCLFNACPCFFIAFHCFVIAFSLFFIAFHCFFIAFSLLYHQGDSKQTRWAKSNLFFDVILKLSEALVCFRASGDNFLRSITRAIVNKNDGERKIDFFEVILRRSEALVCFRASGDNFLRSITRAIAVSYTHLTLPTILRV